MNNRKLILGVLAIIAIFTGATFINLVSADTTRNRAASPQAATVVINEVYGGGGNSGATYNADFVELYNTGAAPFNLSGYSIQYASAGSGNFSQVVVLPADSIPAGGYYLVQLTTAGTVGAALPNPNFIANPTVNISATTGNVLFINSTTAVGATCPASSATTDKIGFGGGTCFETAAAPAGSNTTSDQRTPNGSDTDNNSVDFQAATPSPGAAGGGPTPTISPTVTPTPFGTAVAGIKINEVYGGGGNANALYNQDFVELYNSGAASVNISGYSLQYAPATGTGAYSVCTITATDTVIEPGTYFIASFGTASTTVGAPLPAVNLNCPTTINLSGSAGKIALVSNTTAASAATCPPSSSVVDFVGYGTTATCSETAPAPAPADSSSSISRTPTGTDTNNNAADFTSGAPSPIAGGGTVSRDANVDFDGDGKSDYVVTRTASGQKSWFSSINGNTTGAYSNTPFGITGDIEVPEDYDGDNKDDIAVFRPGAQSVFYILQSSNSTFRSEAFGISGDDPRVVADYDGDNKADIAIYRTSAGGPNVYYYKSSLNGSVLATAWGSGLTVRPDVGDFDGDGKADYCVQYDGGSGSGIFALNKSSGGTEFFPFGFTTDKIAPGDYDGDGKSDFTVVRNQGGTLIWFTLTRANVNSSIAFGSGTDIITPGDYDGDGKTDISVWRPTVDSSSSLFYSRRSSDGGLQVFGFGFGTDYPAANWFVH